MKNYIREITTLRFRKFMTSRHWNCPWSSQVYLVKIANVFLYEYCFLRASNVLWSSTRFFFLEISREKIYIWKRKDWKISEARLHGLEIFLEGMTDWELHKKRRRRERIFQQDTTTSHHNSSQPIALLFQIISRNGKRFFSRKLCKRTNLNDTRS